MKTAILITVLVTLVIASELVVEAEWKQWKLKHNKHYSTQDKEVLKHAVWSKNKKRIDDHNSHADEFGYTLAMNNFGDLVSHLYLSCLVTRTQTLILKLMNITFSTDTRRIRIALPR